MNLKSHKYFTGRILRDSGLGVEPAIKMEIYVIICGRVTIFEAAIS